MKTKILLILTALLFSTLAYGQSDGRYFSRLSQDGTLFFVMPKKIKNVSGIKKFEYDMTLLTQTDSVTVNFTFISPLMDVPKDLKIATCDTTFNCSDYKPLFIDLKKNKYEVRITSKFSNELLVKMLACPTPPVFSFTQGNVSESASYKPGAWAKDRKILNDIFNLYKYTK